MKHKFIMFDLNIYSLTKTTSLGYYLLIFRARNKYGICISFSIVLLRHILNYCYLKIQFKIIFLGLLTLLISFKCY